jgi:hypothetical protein
MPTTADFRSSNEINKPLADRVYHNNYACPLGREIPQNERKYGSNGYQLCDECNRLNQQDR